MRAFQLLLPHFQQKEKEYRYETLLSIEWSPRDIGGDLCNDAQSPMAAS